MDTTKEQMTTGRTACDKGTSGQQVVRASSRTVAGEVVVVAAAVTASALVAAAWATAEAGSALGRAVRHAVRR
jgi:hypothetical protein